ncbi:MAG TPA: gamma-glutamyltransferase [Gemmatimonadales bacterium]|nr:gamma-glutamyltransferase [Gemmatimonadales bacterium]
MPPSLAAVRQPYQAKRAMVVSGEAHATDVGLDVLRSGGNAIDTAVAMGFVLSVTHSGMCGLGGGYILARTGDGRSTFLDFREQAPIQSSRAMFLDSNGRLSADSVTGWRAAAVPGYVLGFDTAHREFGSKPWADLLQPAIDLARNGHPISYLRAQSLRSIVSLLNDPESTRIFLNRGLYYEPGNVLIQADLAQTLERIARAGAKEFYHGDVAHRLADSMKANRGLIGLADLRNYHVSEHQPLQGRYRGYDVLTASGSSSGGVCLLQMLGMLEGSGYEKSGAGSAAVLHFLAEAMRRSFADRCESLGDPDFVQVPYETLLDRARLALLRASVDPDRATPSDQIRPGKSAVREGASTTHFGVVDAAGSAVAVTITLNTQYGSGVTVPGLGFLLNNNMDNFAANPGNANQYGLVQGEANAIQPGKRPAASMTPTIVLKDGKLFMVVGTPGGPTIANSVLQALVNVIDFGLNAQDAVNAPRIHHQWYPDRIFIEPGFSPGTIALLKGRGHEIELRESNNDVNMILAGEEWMQAGIDPRREGKAAGY